MFAPSHYHTMESPSSRYDKIHHRRPRIISSPYFQSNILHAETPEDETLIPPTEEAFSKTDVPSVGALPKTLGTRVGALPKSQRSETSPNPAYLYMVHVKKPQLINWFPHLPSDFIDTVMQKEWQHMSSETRELWRREAENNNKGRARTNYSQSSISPSLQQHSRGTSSRQQHHRYSDTQEEQTKPLPTILFVNNEMMVFHDLPHQITISPPSLKVPTTDRHNFVERPKGTPLSRASFEGNRTLQTTTTTTAPDANSKRIKIVEEVDVE